MTRISTSIAELHDLEQVAYDSGPAILIFSDDLERQATLEQMVTRAGGRISAMLDIGSAIGRIADHAAPDGVIVDLAFTGVEAVADIFDALEHGARADRFRSIALIHPGMIDIAVARAWHSDIQLLCSPEERSLAAAVRTLLAPRVNMLSEGNPDGISQLRELSDEVNRIAHMLAALTARSADPGSNSGAKPSEPTAPEIRAMIRARRVREQFFPAELFADPAWDMLLDLLAARLEGGRVAVSSLCIAAAVPPTTALRWIKTLTDLGMFIRVADPADRRRVFIELAPDVAETMPLCLAAMRQVIGA
jgi:CheY-like chemotaxis protein